MPRLLPVLVGLAVLLRGPLAQAQTLEAIRAAHRLECGTVAGADDWDGADLHGDLSALEGEVCRAIAIAVFGDDRPLTVHAFPGEAEALGALEAGTIQLAVGVSPSTSIAVRHGLGFGPPVFYDTQRLMVARASGIRRLADLRGRLICALDMTPPERALRDELTARGIPYALQSHSEQGELDAALAVRKCEAGTALESRLAQSRASFHAPTGDFAFLPERFGLYPVVPAYRFGDQKLGLLVEWTVSALIEAEALGITKATVAAALGRTDLRAEQLLGHDFATAQALGLAHDWAAQVVAAVGNYGEVFQRTTGAPYHLDRGLNALWTDGGLMRPLPMQ